MQCMEESLPPCQKLAYQRKYCKPCLPLIEGPPLAHDLLKSSEQAGAQHLHACTMEGQCQLSCWLQPPTQLGHAPHLKQGGSAPMQLVIYKAFILGV